MSLINRLFIIWSKQFLVAIIWLVLWLLQETTRSLQDSSFDHRPRSWLTWFIATGAFIEASACSPASRLHMGTAPLPLLHQSNRAHWISRSSARQMCARCPRAQCERFVSPGIACRARRTITIVCVNIDIEREWFLECARQTRAFVRVSCRQRANRNSELERVDGLLRA